MSRVSAAPRATLPLVATFTKTAATSRPHKDLVSQQGRNELYCIRGQAQ